MDESTHIGRLSIHCQIAIGRLNRRMLIAVSEGCLRRPNRDHGNNTDRIVAAKRSSDPTVFLIDSSVLTVKIMADHDGTQGIPCTRSLKL